MTTAASTETTIYKQFAYLFLDAGYGPGPVTGIADRLDHADREVLLRFATCYASGAETLEALASLPRAEQESVGLHRVVDAIAAEKAR